MCTSIIHQRNKCFVKSPLPHLAFNMALRKLQLWKFNNSCCYFIFHSVENETRSAAYHLIQAIDSLCSFDSRTLIILHLRWLT